MKAMTQEIDNGNVDSIFHIGDISYATGFLVEWDYFLNLITPLASRVSYMTAIGNHERYIQHLDVWNITLLSIEKCKFSNFHEIKLRVWCLKKIY